MGIMNRAETCSSMDLYNFILLLHIKMMNGSHDLVLYLAISAFCNFPLFMHFLEQMRETVAQEVERVVH